jgi:uncharacterized protein (TIGR00369 family)
MPSDTSGSSEACRPQVDPGCQQMVGYKTEVFPQKAEARVSLDLGSRHLNRNGVLHGGMVATLLDVACGNAASAHFDPVEHALVVTVSLNLSFVASADDGVIRATGKVSGGGRSLAYVNGELRAEDGRLLATAAGVFKRLRKN